MTEKNTYWLTNGEGTYALVAGAAERDRWMPLGWSAADEPSEGFVYAWREGIAEPGTAALPYFREVLSHTGWVAGPPPGGEHPFAAQPAEESAATVDQDKPTPKKSAAGGRSKDEE